jgi:hypothetical protein
MYKYKDIRILVPCTGVLCCAVGAQWITGPIFYWQTVNSHWYLLLKHKSIRIFSKTVPQHTLLTISQLLHELWFNTLLMRHKSFFRMNFDIFLMLSFKTLSHSTPKTVTNLQNLYKTHLLQKDNSMLKVQ